MKSFYNIRLSAVMILMCILAHHSLGQKTDTLKLTNGSSIIGEVKSFEYGILHFKTDGTSILKVEYNYISKIISTKYFEFRTSDGNTYYGNMMPSSQKGYIYILQNADTSLIHIENIYQITSIEHKFLKRLDGGIDIGLNYTKASNVFQYNVGFNLSQRSKKYSFRNEMSSIFTDRRDEAITTSKNDALLETIRFLPKKWMIGLPIRVQQNTELNLYIRFQSGIIAGYDILTNNKNRLTFLSGILLNYEKFSNPTIEQNNLEGLIGCRYKLFQYHRPQIDFYGNINYYPSITVANRHRIEANIQAKYEIIKSLFFYLTFYESFDGLPNEALGPRNDWGIISSLGYTF